MVKFMRNIKNQKDKKNFYPYLILKINRSCFFENKTKTALYLLMRENHRKEVSSEASSVIFSAISLPR